MRKYVTIHFYRYDYNIDKAYTERVIQDVEAAIERNRAESEDPNTTPQKRERLKPKMAELLKIDMKNTIAVGDYNNDVSMIKAAGKGFAVENAVPEAKAVAKYITVNNNEHAICSIIEGFDREKY